MSYNNIGPLLFINKITNYIVYKRILVKNQKSAHAKLYLLANYVFQQAND